MPVASPAPTACERGAPVARLLGARPGDEVRLLPSARAAYALLAHRVPGPALVLRAPGAAGHDGAPDAALALRRPVRVVPAAATLAGTVARLGEALEEHPAALLAVPGADPVTGELLPVAGLADLAHAHGAALVVDATLLAPAGRLDLAATGADHAVVAAAELPLPAAGAALVGRPLDPAPVPVPSGTSRVPAAAWLGLAQLADLADLPDGVLAAHVAGLRAALVTGLRQLPGVRVLQHWPDATAHAGVLGLAVDGWTPRLLARRLGLDAAGDGVQVRLDAETTTVAVGGLLDALEDVVTSATPAP